MTVQLTSLGQVARAVRDLDAAERFYGGVLGFRKLYRFGDLLFFDMSGVRLLLEKPMATFVPCRSTLYFRVADIALAVTDFGGRGVVFDRPPHRIARMPDHDLWMAFFDDPDGNSLALMSEAPLGWQPADQSQ